MSDEQTVIYTARTAQDAHVLRYLLAQQQIKAVVLGEAIDGLGSTHLGWAASPQVAVAGEDAEPARAIALEFDRQMAAAAASPAENASQPEEPAEVLDVWPTCPECDARRSTRCPVCGTAGRF